jgi:DNA-binding transcriptional regulator GbsR (MarR family)
MFFVSRKKYDELLKQKEDFERIATNAVTQNGRLLDEWDAAIKEMKSIQELNHSLVRDNDELLARCKELKAKLDFVIKQRDYYYDLLEDTSDAYEEGKAISREAE